MHCLLVGVIMLIHCVRSATADHQVLSQTACQGQMLTLSCGAGQVIQVRDVILADSNCYGSNNCCPRSSDCTAQPSNTHLNFVLRVCNGRQSCIFRATKERTSCRVAFIPVNNDYERINYNCVVPTTTTVGEERTSELTTSNVMMRSEMMSTHNEHNAAVASLLQSDQESSSNKLSAWACEGQMLTLSCGAGQVIQVRDVILADSDCYGSNNCCPHSLDCTAQPSDTHRNSILRRCNGRQMCTFPATKERTSCKVLLVSINNDYERINYNCVDVDECTSPSYEGRKCDRHATCTNTPGSFTCRCDSGYIGDGFSCHAPTTTTVRKETTSKLTTLHVMMHSEMMSTDVTNNGYDSAVGSLLQSNQENSSNKTLTSVNFMVIAAGVIGLVLLLVIANMLLWCRLKQQRRRRRVSEKQLELTLRRGASATDGNICLRTTSLSGVDGVECGSSCGGSGRPTAVVRAVDQCSSGVACGQQPVNDVSCSANGCGSGIDSLPGAQRTCYGNLYEKLDHATSGRPKVAAPTRGSVEADYREVALPPAPPPIRALPSCRDAETAAATCCPATELDDAECCYEDIDDYLKPMTEEYEQKLQSVEC